MKQEEFDMKLINAYGGCLVVPLMALELFELFHPLYKEGERHT